MDADDLVTGRFTRCGDDANSREQLAVSLNQLQQTQAMKHTKGMTVLGVGVLESLLCLGVFPVCPAEETVRVGKGGYIVPIALSCDARVVVKVGVSDDEMCYISRMDALLTKLGNYAWRRLITWLEVGGVRREREGEVASVDQHRCFGQCDVDALAWEDECLLEDLPVARSPFALRDVEGLRQLETYVAHVNY